MVHQKLMRMLKSEFKRVIGKEICVFKAMLVNIYMCFSYGNRTSVRMWEEVFSTHPFELPTEITSDLCWNMHDIRRNDVWWNPYYSGYKQDMLDENLKAKEAMVPVGPRWYDFPSCTPTLPHILSHVIGSKLFWFNHFGSG